MRSVVGLLAFTLLASAPLSLASPAFAQPAGAPRVNPSRQELNPERRPAAQPTNRQTELFAPPQQLPCPLANSTVTFKLQGVDIVGSSIGPEAASRAYSDLIGQDIPVSKICEIRDRLTRLLFQRRRLARVEVPEQTISGGRLRLEVTEARIVSVRVQGDIGPAQDKVEGYLSQLRGMAPFDLDTAQRYLLLARDVPGVVMEAALRPSAQGRGALDLDVKLTRIPLDEVAAVQNYGSDTLGPWSVLGRVDFNSFTKFGERTSLIGYRTVTPNEQWIVQLVNEARFGNDGLMSRVSIAYGQSHPGDILKPLNLKGDSLVATGELRYPLLKLARAKVDVSGGVDYVDQSTKFPGGDTLSEDNLRVIWARLGGDYIRSFDGGLFSRGVATIEARKGLSVLGASKANDPNLSRIAGKPDAWLLRFDGEAHLLNRWADLGLKAQGQYTDKPLLSYEEQALGDLTIGRGYEAAAISGDRGIAGEIKLQSTPQTLGFVQLSPFIFYDHGYIQNLDLGVQGRTLRSYGGGIEVRLPYNIRASLAYADPLDKPFPASPEKPSSRVLFQLIVSHP